VEELELKLSQAQKDESPRAMIEPNSTAVAKYQEEASYWKRVVASLDPNYFLSGDKTKDAIVSREIITAPLQPSQIVSSTSLVHSETREAHQSESYMSSVISSSKTTTMSRSMKSASVDCEKCAEMAEEVESLQNRLKGLQQLKTTVLQNVTKSYTAEEMNNVVVQLDKLKADHETLIHFLTEKNDSLQNDKTVLNRSVTAFEAALGDKDRQIEILRMSGQKTLDKMIVEHRKLISALTAKNETLLEEKNSLALSLNAVKASHDEKARQIARSKDSQVDVEQLKADHQKLINVLSSKNDSLLAEKNSVALSLTALQASFAEKISQIESLGLELDKFKSLLNNAREELAKEKELNANNYQLHSQNESVIKEQQKRIFDLNSSIELFKNEIESLQHKDDRKFSIIYLY
jgi:chromosome segregation ATPase